VARVSRLGLAIALGTRTADGAALFEVAAAVLLERGVVGRPIAASAEALLEEGRTVPGVLFAVGLLEGRPIVTTAELAGRTIVAVGRTGRTVVTTAEGRTAGTVVTTAERGTRRTVVSATEGRTGRAIIAAAEALGRAVVTERGAGRTIIPATEGRTAGSIIATTERGTRRPVVAAAERADGRDGHRHRHGTEDGRRRR